MWSRFSFPRFVGILKHAAVGSGAAGAIVGSVYMPFEVLRTVPFDEGSLGIAEAAVVLPFASATGACVGAITGIYIAATLTVTGPFVAYHFGKKHFENKRNETIKSTEEK